MHEFSTTSQIVKTIFSVLEEQKASEVLEVNLEIGRLTFLGLEQLKFCFAALVRGTILEKAKLIIEEKEGIVECNNCGYEGPLTYSQDLTYHMQIPIFTCSTCGSNVKIVAGRECKIKGVKVIV